MHILLSPCTHHHGCWLMCNQLSLSISEMIGLSLCSSFNKWTLQTLVGSSAYPITHLSTTLSFSHFVLQRSSASEMKQQSSDSIRLSATQPSWTSSHNLSPPGPLFFCFSLAPCQKPVITVSAARHGGEHLSAFP